jgi:nitrate reductase gamma subunit
MVIFIQTFLYLSIVILIFGVLFKAIRISQMPVHLRWELYPIPHEKGRAQYGGSYFEESNWWEKPRDVSRLDEYKEMGREIFGIQTLFRNNRLLWYFSFPFHLGLYCLIVFICLIFLGAILGFGVVGISVATSSLFVRLLFSLTTMFGGLGFTLATIGALGLLIMRAIKSDLRYYSTRADYFNLILLLAICAIGFSYWLMFDRVFLFYHSLAENLTTFNFNPYYPAVIKIQIFLVAFFFAYLPFTHMTHFVGKYFTYHSVRWQDQPNKLGDKFEKGVIKSLGEKQDWSAPHIKSGESWAETATDDQPSEDK